MNPSLHTDLVFRLGTLLPVVFVSILLPLLARGRRGLLFGVTVPLDFAAGPIARNAVRRYRLAVSALTLLVLATLLLILRFFPSDSLVSVIATVAAIPLELIVAFLLWHRSAAAIKPYAVLIPLERRADLSPPSATAALTSTALAALPLAASAVLLHLHWSQIPARFADHWNAHGIANGWAERTFSGVYAPLLFGAILIAVFFCVGLFMARASGPQTSQRRRALVPLAVIAWLLSGMLSWVATLPLTHFPPIDILGITLVYLLVVFSVAFWLIHRSGLGSFSKSSEVYDSTPDSAWRGGLIYYNPADASVLVPKRFGFGWTLNFARTASWLYLVGVLLLMAVLIVLAHLLK